MLLYLYKHFAKWLQSAGSTNTAQTPGGARPPRVHHVRAALRRPPPNIYIYIYIYVFVYYYIYFYYCYYYVCTYIYIYIHTHVMFDITYQI